MGSCINLQLLIVTFIKSIISYMRQCKTYMYNNLQRNRVNRSVITVHTCLFTKKSQKKLHKFATTNSNYLKKSTLSDMHHRKRYMHINFQQNRVSKSAKTVHTNLMAKSCKLQLAIRISKNHVFRTCTTPISRSIGPLDIKLLQKEIISTNDRRSYGQKKVVFFEKKKPYQKVMIVAAHLLWSIRITVKFFNTCYNWCILVYILIELCVQSLILYT